MNDLLRRRRAMMEKKSDVLNTSPKIAEYGKALGRSNTGINTPYYGYKNINDMPQG